MVNKGHLRIDAETFFHFFSKMFFFLQNIFTLYNHSNRRVPLNDRVEGDLGYIYAILIVI
jgi:hypothetical protein